MKKLLLILFSIFNTLYPNDDYTIITHENGGTTWIPNKWESSITQENDTIWEPNTLESTPIPQPLNLQERTQLLENYTKGHQLDPDVNLEKIACLTDHLDHQSLVNRAVDIARERSSKTISRKDFDKAFCTLTLGQEKIDTRSAQTIWETAVHEAGHALVCMLLTPDLLYNVSIIQYGNMYGGTTTTLYGLEKNHEDRQKICSFLMVTLAGAAAEEIIFNNDAKLILTDSAPSRFWGDIFAGGIALINLLFKFGGDGVLVVNKSASREEILSYTRIISQRHYDKAKELIKNNKDKLLKIADALVKRKTLTEIEVKELISSSQETVKKTIRPVLKPHHKKNLVYAAHTKRLSSSGLKQKKQLAAVKGMTR